MPLHHVAFACLLLAAPAAAGRQYHSASAPPLAATTAPPSAAHVAAAAANASARTPPEQLPQSNSTVQPSAAAGNRSLQPRPAHAAAAAPQKTEASPAPVAARQEAANASAPRASSLRRPHVKFSLLRTGGDDPCTCQLSDEVCSCSESMRLMDCIVDACTSGKCSCEPYTLHDTCVSVAGTCSSLDIRCSQEKAECMDERQSRSLPEANSTDASKMASELYEVLRELKEKRCRLKLAVEDGWLNAKKQLKVVEDRIKRQMEDLTTMGQPLPEMHCEKHFEEWHEPPVTPAPAKAPEEIKEEGAPEEIKEEGTPAPIVIESNATAATAEKEDSGKQGSPAKKGLSTWRVVLVSLVVVGACSVIFFAMRAARA